MSTPQSTVVLKPLSEFRFDKRKDDWELVSNVPLEGEPTLSLAEFLEEEDGGYVKGDVMLQRSKEMGEDGNAGQLHAERLLEQQDTIPEDWRQHILVFAKTVWRNPDGDLYVPYLFWDDDKWYLLFYWLDNDFHSDSRLVRLGK